MKRRLTTVLLSLLLALSMTPAAFAYGDDGADAGGQDKLVDETIAELAEQLQDKTKDAYGYIDGGRIKSQSTSYPKSFDLRKARLNGDLICRNYVTPVKFQNPFGTCWGFAAIAAAETSILSDPELNPSVSLLKKKYSTSSTQGADNRPVLDLSEKHLVNFLASYIDDPDDPQYGEGMHYLYAKTAAEKFNSGGLPFYATSLFSSGVGPNLTDRDYPESSGKSGDMSDVLGYYGKNKEVQKRKIDGKWVDFCYSPDDDWSIDSAYRFYQSYELEESYLLPSPAGQTEDGQYEYNSAGTAAIKEMLSAGRAVQIGFYADTSMPDQDNEAEFLNQNTWAQYTNAGLQANHAVTIIGWDDNFSKNDFVSGKVPPADGAWLVKNSWGSGEEEFPNRGAGNWGYENSKGQHTGYFWLSYYDQTICMAEALNFDRDNVGKTYYIDQYDFMPVQQANSARTSAELKTANIFTAEQAEQLEQVSCQTSIPGTKVTYDVYLLGDYYRTPVDGVKFASVSEEYSYGGYHKATLDEPVRLQKGQHYSIVVSQKAPDGSNAFSIQYGPNKDIVIYANGSSYCEGVVNPGESYVDIAGDWLDYSDRDLQEMLAGEDAGFMSFDNFPIKGYCTPLDTDKVIKISSGSEILSLIPSENSCTLQMRFHGAGGTYSPEISWRVADGYEDMISITPADSSSSCDKVTVKALSYGDGRNNGAAYVVADVEDIGSTVVRLFVWRHDLLDVSLSQDEFDYTGGEITPEAEVKCYNSGCELVEGTDYTVSYENNIEPGTAKMTVTGIGDHQGTVTAQFVIKAADGDDPVDPDGSAEPDSGKSDGAEAGPSETVPAVQKAAGSVKAQTKKLTFKASSLRKKAKKIAISKAIAVKEATGDVTYTKVSGNKKITINSNTGKIRVGKGLKRKTYKVKVKVSAAENENYTAAEQIVTIKIRVK